MKKGKKKYYYMASILAVGKWMYYIAFSKRQVAEEIEKNTKGDYCIYDPHDSPVEGVQYVDLTENAAV